MTDVEKAKTDEEIWIEILANKDKYMLVIDNDITFVMDAANEDVVLYVFQNHTGDDEGFLALLNVLQIKYELV